MFQTRAGAPFDHRLRLCRHPFLHRGEHLQLLLLRVPQSIFHLAGTNPASVIPAASRAHRAELCLEIADLTTQQLDARDEHCNLLLTHTTAAASAAALRL